jgi:hypothetical protein
MSYLNIEEPLKPAPDEDALWAKGMRLPFSFFAKSFLSFLTN